MFREFKNDREKRKVDPPCVLERVPPLARRVLPSTTRTNADDYGNNAATAAAISNNAAAAVEATIINAAASTNDNDGDKTG